ncbi:helix-turn-helix domain-containing protein [Ureibacillus massiliensis]|uniref:helix-turn-helix domain-containing protein n=1 Tax=Ureibacillus massiliensis TaxID=292806 RepID=UPI00055CAB1C|nr:helix-turn-helix transcriptional regulator [Ureibacillus massiliensis]
MEESLGALLKKLRKEKELTLNQLSDLTGISQPYLSQLESNKRKPSAVYLHRISDVLDVPYSALIKLSGNPDFIDKYNSHQIKEGFPERIVSKIVPIDSDRLEALESATDLKVLLEQDALVIKAEKIKPSFNGHLLTEDEAERALAMLYLLFPQYKEPKE